MYFMRDGASCGNMVVYTDTNLMNADVQESMLLIFLLLVWGRMLILELCTEKANFRLDMSGTDWGNRMLRSTNLFDHMYFWIF